MARGSGRVEGEAAWRAAAKALGFEVQQGSGPEPEMGSFDLAPILVAVFGPGPDNVYGAYNPGGGGPMAGYRDGGSYFLGSASCSEEEAFEKVGGAQ